jgi:hypothetical protein
LSCEFLAALEAFAGALQTIGDAPPPAPRWTQDWFPRLDAAAAYAMVRTRKPRRIVEVGSGHSTRFMARAIADGALGTTLTCIDPRPRASIQGLPVEWLSQPVQQANPSIFEGLDLLFIDSSHQLKPGSDVEFLLEQALPALPAGAHVHFHDIFLPDPYPQAWAWRNYNEQQAVAELLRRGAFSVVFSSHQCRGRLGGSSLARLPLVPGALESSLWLRKS